MDGYRAVASDHWSGQLGSSVTPGQLTKTKSTGNRVVLILIDSVPHHVVRTIRHQAHERIYDKYSTILTTYKYSYRT